MRGREVEVYYTLCSKKNHICLYLKLFGTIKIRDFYFIQILNGGKNGKRICNSNKNVNKNLCK